MPRTRTTKKLAQRIGMNYFKRSAPFRRWKFWLSVALPALALVWIGWFALRGDAHAFSAGRMSPAHALLASRCEVCHVRAVGGFSARAADSACLACHDGPPHHADAAFMPSCATCHVEHRGARLAATADSNCTRCHGDLHANGAAPSIVRNISAFPAQHPEFAALRSGRGDPTSIKLNHYRHMQANLTGPRGPVQLVCQDCHRTAADSRAWPYAAAASSNALAQPAGSPPHTLPSATLSTAYMAAPTYANNCAACHTLEFDKRFTEAVPHDKPEVVHAFLLQKFQAYIASHPAELHERVAAIAGQPDRDLPVKPVPVADRTVTSAQWVAERVGEAEQLLWRKTCVQCHTLDLAPGATLPSVHPSNIAARFMPNARFDHSAHQGLTCTSCHARATTSQESADLLLPGIATCGKCHGPSSSPVSSLIGRGSGGGSLGEGTAESGCFECHTYHDPAKRRVVPGRFGISDLARNFAGSAPFSN